VSLGIGSENCALSCELRVERSTMFNLQLGMPTRRCAFSIPMMLDSMRD